MIVSDVSSNLSLARFLRDDLRLTGTKISCGQGGCGACIVTASIPNDTGYKIISVNSVIYFEILVRIQTLFHINVTEGRLRC